MVYEDLLQVLHRDEAALRLVQFCEGLLERAVLVPHPVLQRLLETVDRYERGIAGLVQGDVDSENKNETKTQNFCVSD